MRQLPTLVGVSGFFEGESFPLEFGQTVIVGRSRTAEISLRRTRRYRALPVEDRETDPAANTVSKQHFSITVHSLHEIEVKNLSRNGTRLDAEKIESSVVTDALRSPRIIRFGKLEAFRLVVREYEEGF